MRTANTEVQVNCPQIIVPHLGGLIPAVSDTEPIWFPASFSATMVNVSCPCGVPSSIWLSTDCFTRWSALLGKVELCMSKFCCTPRSVTGHPGVGCGEDWISCAGLSADESTKVFANAEAQS